MTEILRQKIIKLVRGDDGVALVVTLALFMFLYVSCAGVYTVGRAVKDRIILQNAVDAAAYSAAVVQADYLSRIATINRAMAWNYVQFVKSQKNWIALKFLKTVNDAALMFNKTDGQQGVWVEFPDEAKEKFSKSDLISAVSGKDLATYEKEISEYFSRLVELNLALHDKEYGLGEKLRKDVEQTAEDVLRANLPFRLGELCRRNLKVENVTQEMNSEEDEEDFIGISRDDIEGREWYEFAGEGSGFKRGVKRLVALEGETSNDEMNWLPRKRIDAETIANDAESILHLDYVTIPLKLIDNYFLRKEGDSSLKGSITVAVAKFNENPWKMLLEDLTGIHAAFDYGEKNDWTFAIASAQAGYRSGGDDLSGEAREYSLNGETFDFVSFAKKGGEGETYNGQDWDAVLLPVRMAFNSDEFADWIENSAAWEPLVSAGNRKYVKEDLQNIRFYELNHEALARMHNNEGTKKILKWDEDESKKFLDLMYH